MQDALHEISKPVARYADDADLDRMLRAQEREGDPMLEYMRSKGTNVAVPSKLTQQAFLGRNTSCTGAIKNYDLFYNLIE